MKTFYIIVNPDKDPDMVYTNRLTHFLDNNDCKYMVQRATKQGKSFYTDASCIPVSTQCIIVLGGDGTLIEAARDTVDLNIPLLGINLGKLGFLAEIDRDGIEESMARLLRDEYAIESRMMLVGEIVRDGEVISRRYAINDVVVSRSGPLRVLKFSISVNGQYLASYKADGVIASTPTGSTGYNLSVGGPIVEPSARTIVVSAISAHTLNARSIVLSPEDVVTFEVKDFDSSLPGFAEVSFDAGYSVKLLASDRVVVKMASKTADIVKLNQCSFIEVLKQRMG